VWVATNKPKMAGWWYFMYLCTLPVTIINNIYKNIYTLTTRPGLVWIKVFIHWLAVTNKNCPTLTLQNGKLSTRATSIGTVVDMSCNDQYRKIAGETRVKCVSGKWSGKVLACKRRYWLLHGYYVNTRVLRWLLMCSYMHGVVTMYKWCVFLFFCFEVFILGPVLLKFI
jgi:hypothetical protein